ncbi:MAG: hypothetical protein R3C68_12975 [Myxococcota bacterium]
MKTSAEGVKFQEVMDKTVVVNEVVRKFRHPKYPKFVYAGLLQRLTSGE